MAGGVPVGVTDLPPTAYRLPPTAYRRRTPCGALGRWQRLERVACLVCSLSAAVAVLRGVKAAGRHRCFSSARDVMRLGCTSHTER